MFVLLFRNWRLNNILHQFFFSKLFLLLRILTLIRFLLNQLLNRRFFLGGKHFKYRFWLNYTYLTDLILKIKHFIINFINWLDFLKIKSVNSARVRSCDWREENSFGLHLLVINFLNHALLIVWAWEEDRILKAEGTLFCDETFESFVTEVAVLIFSILCEFFDWRLRVVPFVSAIALWSLLGLRRIARNFKTIEVTFFTWDVKITKDVTFNWLKGTTSLTVFWKVHVGINFLHLSYFFVCFLRLSLLSILNIFQIFKELLIFNTIQNIILVLNHIRIV